MPPKKCKCLPSIATLTMITEQPGTSTAISRDRVSLLNGLLNVLLDMNFDENGTSRQRAAHFIDELKVRRCPRVKIDTRILSVFAYHEAMGLPDWQKCKESWIRACQWLQINEFAVGQAISVGQSIRAQLGVEFRDRIDRKDAVRQEVQKVFFGPKRVFKQLT